MRESFVVEPLGRAHNRQRFTCGVETLDRYLREYASQDIRRKLSSCFVAIDTAGEIAGYYTFAASSLLMTDLSSEEAKRLPRYPLLPAGLIGRLAIAAHYTRQGLGSSLILDAVVRASRAELAIFALIVDAKDDNAKRFYQHLGFRPLKSRPLSLYWPIAEAAKQLSS